MIIFTAKSELLPTAVHNNGNKIFFSKSLQSNFKNHQSLCNGWILPIVNCTYTTEVDAHNVAEDQRILSLHIMFKVYAATYFADHFAKNAANMMMLSCIVRSALWHLNMERFLLLSEMRCLLQTCDKIFEQKYILDPWCAVSMRTRLALYGW